MVEPRGTVSICAGREIHWREREGEGPTVVLMAGCGLAMEFWRGVSRMLPTGRLLAYDRPGMGGTRWPRRLPTLAEEVASLAELMQQRKTGPSILVAHSMAAFHAEALARQHPELVRGIVLVDGSQEWPIMEPPAVGPGMATFVLRAVRHIRLGRAASAIFRLGTYWQSHWEWRRLGHGRLDAVYRDQDALAMATAEAMAYDGQAWELLQVRREFPWPGVPTIVLTADDSSDDQEIARQARLASFLGAKHVVVPRSQHLMMLDRPDAIVDAVDELRLS